VTPKKTTPPEAAEPKGFDLDAFIAEARQDPFRFKLGGRWFELVHAGQLDKRLLTELDFDRVGPSTFLPLMRAGMTEADWEAFDALPVPLSAVGELFEQWQAHGGTSVGESSASSTS